MGIPPMLQVLLVDWLAPGSPGLAAGKQVKALCGLRGFSSPYVDLSNHDGDFASRVKWYELQLPMPHPAICVAIQGAARNSVIAAVSRRETLAPSALPTA